VPVLDIVLLRHLSSWGSPRTSASSPRTAESSSPIRMSRRPSPFDCSPASQRGRGAERQRHRSTSDGGERLPVQLPNLQMSSPTHFARPGQENDRFHQNRGARRRCCESASNGADRPRTRTPASPNALSLGGTAPQQPDIRPFERLCSGLATERGMVRPPEEMPGLEHNSSDEGSTRSLTDSGCGESASAAGKVAIRRSVREWGRVGGETAVGDG
jgi:hypothetical protein